MSDFKSGDVVVHKSIGNTPLVVLFSNKETTTIRFGNQTPHGLDFATFEFQTVELETPIESIEREAELFQILTAKKEEMNGYKKGPVAVN